MVSSMQIYGTIFNLARKPSFLIFQGSFCCLNQVRAYLPIFLLTVTDYGRTMKLFFYKNPKFLGMGRQIRPINFGAFGVFSAEPISTHFGTVTDRNILDNFLQVVIYFGLGSKYLGEKMGEKCLLINLLANFLKCILL